MKQDMTVQETSAARAENLPGAERTHQSAGDWELWKVGGKLFMLQTAMPGEPVVVLKADPADAETLREAHPQISEGYHMNKRHWITLHPGQGLDTRLIDDLVTESYLLVIEGLPKGQRPIDPSAFRLGTTAEPVGQLVGRPHEPARPDRESTERLH